MNADLGFLFGIIIGGSCMALAFIVLCWPPKPPR